MKIEVTEEDIKKGDMCNAYTCPIALAVTRQTGTPCRVNGISIRIYDKDYNTYVVYFNSVGICSFISSVDMGLDVSPMTIILEKDNDPVRNYSRAYRKGEKAELQ